MIKPSDHSPSKVMMKRRLLTLLILLLVLVTVLNTSLYVNYERQSSQLIENNIMGSLNILRGATAVAEELFEPKFKAGLQEFLKEYEAHGHDMQSVDLVELQRQLGEDVDLYAIDSSGVVRYSTVPYDIGLDFNYWPELLHYQENIRQAGILQIDSISKETLTGLLRQYAYLPTADKRWLLEIGIKPESIAKYLKPFDPFVVTEQMIANNSQLNNLRIIDAHGWQLSMSQPVQVEPEIMEQVQIVLKNSQPLTTFRWNRLVRYLPLPDTIKGNTFGVQMQVVEIDYNITPILLGILTNLLAIIFGVVIILKLGRWIEQYESRLEQFAVTDSLTKLANRRRLNEVLEVEWARAHRNRQSLALLFIDIDYFKKYNDHFGHLAGDDCLIEIAYVLRDCAQRSGELAARYGGEEFVVILPSSTLDQAQLIAEHIRQRIFSLNLPNPESVHQVVSVSIGVASIVPEDGVGPSTLLGAADKAVYCAKENGRNSVA